ncbi:mfs multidrug transporter [Diaporthe amygdali]|uniref:mfs multidrug transporter n=1 Tax=Phomopsis amygdali TaxID=1214568 RepID=UPI0022FF1F78|nr:mfs multidrug transporter [Diaporthe amygdali]KAJ0123613.1 mfs multidrug transporter [Diaporthe amygdali]
MASLFCCGSIKPYRPQALSHESKFIQFMRWANSTTGTTSSAGSVDLVETAPDFVVQLVRQVNFGPLESKRYFAPTEGDKFVEVSENDLVQANFQKLNSYKNYKCDDHNKFFELNLYQKDPVNKHHWRANLARPASDIDL